MGKETLGGECLVREAELDREGNGTTVSQEKLGTSVVQAGYSTEFRIIERAAVYAARS